MNTKIELKPILYWIDDDKDIDDGSVAFNFRPVIENAGFDCRFFNPDDLMNGAGVAMLSLKEEIESGRVRVFILDWQDGMNDGIYVHLREALIKAETRVILKSIYGPALLAAQGVYQRFPELSAYSYWREDGPQKLLELIPQTDSASQHLSAATLPFNPLSLVNQLPIRLLKLSHIQAKGPTGAATVTELWRSDSWTLDREVELPEAADCPEPQFGIEVQLLQGADPRPPHGEGPMLESKWVSPSQKNKDRLVWQLRQALPAWSTATANPYRSSEDCLRLILTLTAQAGLTRGRYYQITHIDGLERPLLELTHCTPQAKKRLPVAAEMDTEEESLFTDYANLRKPTHEARKSLVFHTRSMKDFSDSPNDAAVWNTVIPQPNEPLDECWLVPVFRQTKESNTDTALTSVQGVFIFDLGGPGPIPERATKNLAMPILNALMDLSAAQRSDALKQRAWRADRLRSLQATMAQANSVDDAERILVDSVLEIVLQAISGVNGEKVVRSAAFARYEASTHSLVVGADTDGLMKGFQFLLGDAMKPFVMVRAALAGLQQLQLASSSGTEAQYTSIEYVPDMSALNKAQPDLAITENHWGRVVNCTASERSKCRDWLEQVHSVVSIPILDRAHLLGTLTLRSSNRYEFTKSVVDNLREVATMAKPVLARMRAEASRRDFSTLVTHELRSILSKTRMSIGSKEQTGLNRLLDHGYAYSSLLLRHAGTSEPKGGGSDAQLWQRLQDWGEDLKSIQSEPCEWEMLHDPILVLSHSTLLEQVLLVLLDNAFRYAKVMPGNSCITLSVQAKEFAETEPSAKASNVNTPTMARIFISNPGDFSQQDLDQLEYGDIGKKSHVGLMLAKQFCQEEGGCMEIQCKESTVTVCLTWPLVVA